MSVVVTRDSPTWQPATEDAEEIVTEALRDLARWLYRQLEVEYDHLTSDEAIEEGIIVNEYTFTEAGRRFGEARPSKNFPDRTLETYVDMAYIDGRPFRRRPCSGSTIPRARSTNETRPG